jgi:hypothetical protein
VFFALTVTNAIPAARVPKALAITIDRVINKTSAVATDAETPIRSDSFMRATKMTKVSQ